MNRLISTIVFAFCANLICNAQLLKIFGESIPSDPIEDYGNNIKWITFISGSYTVGATIMIDMADYMGITNEGKEGWVTVWVDATADLGFPFGLGCVPRKFDPNNPDDPEYTFKIEANVTFPGISISAAKLQFGDPFLQFMNVTFGAAAFNVSGGVALNIYSFEIQKSILDANLNSRGVPGMDETSYTNNIMLNLLTESLDLMNYIDKSVRKTTVSDDSNEDIIKSIRYSNLVVGKWGVIAIDIIPKVSNNYKFQIWDPSNRATPPEWEWANETWSGSPKAGPTYINANQPYTFVFSVRPTDIQGDFIFWLYEEIGLGIYKYSRQVTIGPIYALPAGTDLEPPYVDGILCSEFKGSDVTINFSEPINEFTINDKTLTITGSQSGSIIYSKQFSNENRAILINPINDFIIGESIEIVVTAYIQDRNGNKLVTQKVKTFTVKSSSDITVNSLVISSDKYSPAINTAAQIQVEVKDEQGQLMANQPINFSHTNTGSFTKLNPVYSDATGIANISYTPAADGNHLISASSINGKTAALTLNVGGSIWPPTITVNYPYNEICHDICYIAWSASDPDNNAAIYLYYDSNNSGFDGTCINPGKPVFKDVANVYEWNTVSMPNGKYWVYAVIDDGTTQAKDYSPGYIEVKHPQVSTDFSFSSKTTNETLGDGDQIVETGETFELDLRIRNNSTTKSYTQVNGILTTTTSNVTITDNDSYFGDFSTGISNWGDDDYKIVVGSGFTGNIDLDVQLEFRDASGYQYYQVVDIPGINISQNVSPGFEVVGIEVVDDGAKCNNDGILHSGENSIQYKLQLKNKGSGNAVDVYCEAQEIPEFETEKNTASYPDIPSGASIWCDLDDHFVLRQIPPDFTGTLNGQVNVYWADRQFSQMIPFSFQVQPAPRLRYDPQTNDFGIKALGETAVVPITLINYGSSDIIISQIEDVSANPNNSVTGLTFPVTIAPGNSKIAEIRIKRENPENVNLIYRIHSNNFSLSVQDIFISGTFFNPQPQGYKKLWESGATSIDDCIWIEPTDLDNDGLIDMVMYYRNEVFFWEQKSANAFEFEYKYTYTVPGIEPYIKALQVGNIDGDNLKDIVIRNTDQGVVPQAAFLRVLESAGNNTYSQVWSTPSPTSETDHLTVGNCDSDPEDEIIVGSIGSGGELITVYNKTGNNAYQATWNSGSTIQPYCSYMGFATTGDTDKDGKNEIIVLGAENFIFIWEFDGTYSLVHTPLVTFNPVPEWGDAVYPIINDVDNDSKNEIIITGDGTDGWQFVVFNPDTWSISFHNSIGLYGVCTSPTSADLNGNGIPEIFFGEEDSPYRLVVYEYDNGSYFETFTFTNENGNEIWNVEPLDFNNDGSPEVVLSNYNSFMIWGYEEPPILPDLKIAANNFILSTTESTDADSFTITAKIQNIGTTNALNVPVVFYLSDPVNGNILKSFMIDDLPVLDETVLTFSTKLSQIGDYDIYVVINPEGTVEELETSNNSQFKSIKIVDNDIAAPEFISHSHTELSGDNDGLIEDDEYIQINWNLSDISGINSTYVVFKGAQIAGMSKGNGNYFAIVEYQIPGDYSYEIHASDNDNTSLSSVISFALKVIQGSPRVISKTPVAGETGVLTTSKVEAVFDLALNPSTINGSNFLVSESVSGTLLSPLSINYYPELKKVVFDPTLLKYETEYKVRLLSGINGIKDINNNSLETDVIWNFVTIKAPLVSDFYITNKELRIETVLYFKDISSGNPVSWYWDFGDGQLSTSQNPEHIYHQSGIYNVRLIVIDSEGHTSSKTISIDAVVSKVVKYAENTELSIYPNPAVDIVYLRSTIDIKSGLRISILDNTGRLILTKSVEVLYSDEPIEIDVSSLKEGIYIIKFDNSVSVRITKLIKQ